MGAWNRPSPSLLPVTIVDMAKESISSVYEGNLLRLPFLFVDEGYDPTSRVRKGRIFEKTESQPTSWHVHPHPAVPSDISADNNGVVEKQLVIFRQFNFSLKLKHLEIIDACLVIGTSTHCTIWNVVDMEASVSGETILYLKSRKVIGALPKINYSIISDISRQKNIQEKIDHLARDIGAAVPDSIVDRCREAASSIINTYLIQNNFINSDKDLGQLPKIIIENAQKNIVADCAGLLAKLHSRTKFVEQSKRKIRNISEHDAEFAVHTLGAILVELGWGYW